MIQALDYFMLTAYQHFMTQTYFFQLVAILLSLFKFLSFTYHLLDLTNFMIDFVVEKIHLELKVIFCCSVLVKTLC
jgi:hypothetical protein